ncbi:MAG: barstar family protein [Burkholderiales bacterium]|nr:barstar family protein [Burkholderiales bacterium]
MKTDGSAKPVASGKLAKLFEADAPRGVFWLKDAESPATVAKLAKAKGLAYFHLEGKSIEKKEQFLNHAAIVMHFPDYFGNNWDAFEECITDFEWLDAEGFVIHFDHTDNFAAHHESQLETVVELFQDAVDYWKGEGKPMLVLLSGSEPVPGVKKL